MSIKKIINITLFFAAAALLSAQTARIKIATIAPARSSWDIEENAMAQEWARITGGAVTLQFMSATAMGGEGGVVQKLNSVRPGQRAPIGGAVFTSLGVNELVPEANILTMSVPGLFRDQREVSMALEEFSSEMQKPILDRGYVVLGWFSVGWAYFFTKNEARTPEALKKQRLCVGSLTAPALTNAFKAAGYTTMDVPADKLLQSLKTPGGVEGLYTLPMYAYAAQYCKSVPYILDVPLCPVMAAFLISKDVWAEIPEKYKPAMIEAVKNAEKKFIVSQEKDNIEYLNRCRDSGATLVSLDSSERRAFQDSFVADSKKMYEAKEPVVNKALYDKISAFIKKSRGE
ncbi:TRAP transporter substrate-binding protein DctP [Treponema parvum]|uniref:TRAP transporter substrate-binding protein DctP n=1 Tax=Treponema parvum TaxID=138851 RepID=A0A975IC67_9SPIR|nr:TRAP transporter substrate-binding protein DctP [Treponema parvum]QTQ11427.1 TRAP transporter substrate-binding protein DctP [Treponema parvum]QTQ16632.1 TRAP transporter substrate-binding protein DctP [Treponema parvum]